QVDVRSPEVVDLIARRDPDVVFHLAATRPADPADDAFANVVGAVNVLEGARLGGSGKIVFATGAGMYGEPDPAALPVRESHALVPTTAHAVAKKAVLDYLRLYRERHGIEFTALALASVYGPRQRPRNGVVATFAQAVLHGLPVELHGTGAQTRDFVYVDNAVDALVRAATRGSGLLVNVGCGMETPIRQVLALVAEAAGVAAPTPVSVERPPGDIDRQALDPGRAKIQLGWSPWTSLGEGVAETLRWSAVNPV
ncbi:MAG: NAD-dependent epimerase/dehydratase, partial [Actinomycetia bacterium]|nr:NAD-dependent epimerase/dehydratase [Actinomycetes bacterium]